MKRCKKCQEVKKPSHFNKSAFEADGLQTQCRVCRFDMRVNGPSAHELRAVKIAQAEHAQDTLEAKSYVASLQARTRCGQCDRLGVIFCHPARDRFGKIFIAGFTTMSEIDGRIEDMVPLCMICKPLIEKCKIQTTLFD